MFGTILIASKTRLLNTTTGINSTPLQGFTQRKVTTVNYAMLKTAKVTAAPTLKPGLRWDTVNADLRDFLEDNHGMGIGELASDVFQTGVERECFIRDAIAACEVHQPRWTFRKNLNEDDNGMRFSVSDYTIRKSDKPSE